MNTTPDKLTRTETETLATMLNGSFHAMARATDITNRLVWDSTSMNDAVIETCEGFYDIQRRHAPANQRVYI
jgi:hypothetical protein